MLTILLALLTPANGAVNARNTAGVEDATAFRAALDATDGAIQVQELYMTPGGEWIVVSNQGTAASSGFSLACTNAVLAERQTGNVIQAVASDDNHWIVVSDDNVVISDSSLSMLRAWSGWLLASGATIEDIVLDPDGLGWGIATSIGFFQMNLPTDLVAAATDAQAGGRQVRVVSLNAQGDWVVVADNWYATKGVSSRLRRFTDGWQTNGQSLDYIVLSPTFGYARVSNGAFGVGGGVLGQAEANVGGVDAFARMNALGVANLNIASRSAAGVLEYRSYGRVVPGGETYLDSETIVDTASISKTVAVAVTLAVISDGRWDLNLDDRVGDIANAQPWGTGIRVWWVYAGIYAGPMEEEATIAQLLSHTSGLEGAAEDWGGAKRFDVGDRKPRIEEVLMDPRCTTTRCTEDVRDSLFFSNAPGTTYNYSGGGYAVLQGVLEAVTGERFEDLARELVFDPLEMNRSSFEFREFLMPNTTVQLSNGMPRSPQTTYWAQGAANLQTTPRDMGRFLDMLASNGVAADGERLIDQDLMDTMFTPTEITNNGTVSDLNYGLGLRVDRSPSCASLNALRLPWYGSHGGTHLGLRARFVVDRGTGAWWFGSAEGLSGSAGPTTLIANLETSIVAAMGWNSACIR